MLGHFTLSHDLVLGNLVLSQHLILKCWEISQFPKTTHSSVGTLRTVPRHFFLVLGHFKLSQDLVLGHLALSQDLPLKCWDTSYCRKTINSSVGQFALSQDLPLKCWDTSHCPKTPHSSVGILRTVPRLPPRVLGHLALSQDLVLGHFILSQDLSLKCWGLSHCPTTFHSSVGTLRTVPRPFLLVLGHFTLSQHLAFGQLALSQDLPLKCWDI